MKKLIALILALLCAAAFSVSSFAASEEYDVGEYVNDEADLLSDDEEQELESIIDGIREKYDFDVAICTVMSTDGENIETYAEEYYITNPFSFDGLVFVINLNNNESGNREFYTYYCGSVYNTFGEEAYNSDDGYINEHIISYLVIGDYYSAFKEYLTLTESFAEDYEYYFSSRTDGDYDYYDDIDGYYSGSYDNSNSLKSIVIKEIIVVALGAVAAFFITQMMKNKMNTAVIKREASDYVKEGSFNVTKSLDVFTYKNIVSTPKAPPANDVNHTGGGFSGGGHSGGGHSGGGGGKF